ncbi:hypothetical protein BDQ17DRAFT_1330885 [Cyathus striatus]|nr:hypothetical protein BDQ17DRAFT_1330885 [Cyathus striatus]
MKPPKYNPTLANVELSATSLGNISVTQESSTSTNPIPTYELVGLNTLGREWQLVLARSHRMTPQHFNHARKKGRQGAFVLIGAESRVEKIMPLTKVQYLCIVDILRKREKLPQQLEVKIRKESSCNVETTVTAHNEVMEGDIDEGAKEVVDAGASNQLSSSYDEWPSNLGEGEEVEKDPLEDCLETMYLKHGNGLLHAFGVGNVAEHLASKHSSFSEGKLLRIMSQVYMTGGKCPICGKENEEKDEEEKRIRKAEKKKMEKKCERKKRKKKERAEVEKFAASNSGKESVPSHDPYRAQEPANVALTPELAEAEESGEREEPSVSTIEIVAPITMNNEVSSPGQNESTSNRDPAVEAGQVRELN